MSAQDKLDRVLELLTDKTVGKLVKQGQLTKAEEYAGLVTIGAIFRQAVKISEAA